MGCSPSRAIEGLAVHVKYLGVGDAATTMGAIEYLATAVERGSSRIADAGDAIAGAIEKLAVKVESASETIGQRITEDGSTRQ